MNKFKFFRENNITTPGREYHLYEEMIVQLMVHNSRNNISDIGSTHFFNENGHQCEIKILQTDCQLFHMVIHYRIFYSFNYLFECFHMELTYRDLNRLIDESI